MFRRTYGGLDIILNMALWQQVLALDAKYNNFRAPHEPSFKKLYLRRRSHLLKTSSHLKTDSLSTNKLNESSENQQRVLPSYISLRTHLLQQKYKVSLDELSHRSSRPSSRIMSLTESTTGPLTTAFRATIASSGFGPRRSSCNSGVVPTNQASASKAIMGSASLAENYAFSGVHHVFDQHQAAITMLKFGHNDNTLLGCSSADGSVTICVAGDEPAVLHTLRYHKAAVMCVDWSSSNDHLASCSKDGVVCVWKADTGQLLRAREPPCPGVSATTLLFHPINCNWLIVGGGDAGGTGGLLQVVVLSTGHTVYSCSAPAAVTALAFSTDGTTLWAGDEKANITAFKINSDSGLLRKACRTSINIRNGGGVPIITDLAHRTWASREARDPSLLASVSCDLLLLYSVVDDCGSLVLRQQVSVPHSVQLSLRAVFPPLMSFHEGAAVVSGSEDGSVLFLDFERPQRPVINRLQGHGAPVLCPAFNYTESLLASGDSSGVIIVWRRHAQVG